MGALAQAVRSGKALYVGLSNYDGPTLEKACKILSDLHCPFILNQNRYSIFDRTIEHNGLKDTAAKLQKGIIAFSPLAQGMLTDRYLHGIPEDSRIKKRPPLPACDGPDRKTPAADQSPPCGCRRARTDARRNGAQLDFT